MKYASNFRNVETVYDLLLPEDIGTIVNMHWHEQPPLQRVGERRLKLISVRLEEYLSSADTGEAREERRRLGGDPGKLPLALDSAECIVLHHILDNPPVRGLSQRACREQLMRICKATLAPDGVLAIACQNCWSIDRLRGALSGPRPLLTLASARGGLSLLGCRRLLYRAAFKVSEAFAVVPSMENPTAIISTRREAAQIFYGRAMAQVFNNVPHWAVPLVKLLNGLNARACLEPTFFVLARHD